jgi:hypothetical protein
VRDNRYELNSDNVCQQVRHARRDTWFEGGACGSDVHGSCQGFARVGRRRTGTRLEAITSAHAVLPLCGAHHTALFFIAFRHNYDGHDVKSRVRMPLSTLFIGIVRRAGCGMQEASRDRHGVVNIQDGYIVRDNGKSHRQTRSGQANDIHVQGLQLSSMRGCERWRKSSRAVR